MAEEATSPAAETRTERHLRLLALLADRSVELACHLQEAALAAPDLTEKSRLARDFYFVDRAARQSILSEARLARQAVRDDRETAKHNTTQATEAAAIRKARVQAGVERRIWTELDGGEAEAWTADLADRLDDEALGPGFADEDLDAHIDRTAQALGLTGEEHHDYVPRTLRRGSCRPSRHDWRAIIDKMDFDDEDEDEAPPKAATPPAPEPPKAPAPPPAADDDTYEPDFGPPPDDEPPPPRPKRESEREPEPPPEPPPPTPPPEPEPRPYIPPWDQIPRGHRFPGGDSGW